MAFLKQGGPVAAVLAFALPLVTICVRYQQTTGVPHVGVRTTVKESAIACPSRDLLDEATAAASRGDTAVLASLNRSGCIGLPVGAQVGVLEVPYHGLGRPIVKVRLYGDFGETARVLWTANRALKGR